MAGTSPAMTRMPGSAQAALTLRCLNMLLRASSSISALNVKLSFSAIAFAAAGRAEISSTSRLTLGYFATAFERPCRMAR